MKVTTESVAWVIAGGAILSLGCAGPDTTAGPAHVVCPAEVTTAAVIQAAHDVLAEMHFPIEKQDVEQGIIRTRPLRAGQFFEFWRGDNAGAFNTAEANLQSIRRTVEIRVKMPERASVEASMPPAAHSIECDVQVQRLALPANEVAGVSQAYRMHTRSEPTVQTLEVSPEQRAQMAWIDLGSDPELAAEILRRIGHKLGH